MPKHTKKPSKPLVKDSWPPLLAINFTMLDNQARNALLAGLDNQALKEFLDPGDVAIAIRYDPSMQAVHIATAKGEVKVIGWDKIMPKLPLQVPTPIAEWGQTIYFPPDLDKPPETFEQLLRLHRQQQDNDGQEGQGQQDNQQRQQQQQDQWELAEARWDEWVQYLGKGPRICTLETCLDVAVVGVSLAKRTSGFCLTHASELLIQYPECELWLNLPAQTKGLF